jgi:5-methylcytosine-specific restriction endonuclease McrA
MCEAMTPPRVTAGAEVDHIQPLAKGGADVWDNLQTLCHDHHRDKSAMDKGHRVRLTTGADGWPIETGYNPRKV